MWADAEPAVEEDEVGHEVPGDPLPDFIRCGGGVEGVWMFSRKVISHVGFWCCGTPFFNLFDVDFPFDVGFHLLNRCPFKSSAVSQSRPAGVDLVAPCAFVDGSVF